jgi:hypothetical protein
VVRYQAALRPDKPILDYHDFSNSSNYLKYF